MSAVAECIRPLEAYSLLRMGLDVRIGKRVLLLADGQPLGILPPGRHDLESLSLELDRRALARLRSGRLSLVVLEDREICLQIELDDVSSADGVVLRAELQIGVRINDPEAFHAGLPEHIDRLGTRQLSERVRIQARALLIEVIGASEGAGVGEAGWRAKLQDTLLVQIEPALARYGLVVNFLQLTQLAPRSPQEALTPAAAVQEPSASSLNEYELEAQRQEQLYQLKLRELRADANILIEQARCDKLRLDAEIEARRRVFHLEMEERAQWFEQQRLEAAGTGDLQAQRGERLEGAGFGDPQVDKGARLEGLHRRGPKQISKRQLGSRCEGGDDGNVEVVPSSAERTCERTPERVLEQQRLLPLQREPN